MGQPVEELLRSFMEGFDGALHGRLGETPGRWSMYARPQMPLPLFEAVVPKTPAKLALPVVP